MGHPVPDKPPSTGLAHTPQLPFLGPPIAPLAIHPGPPHSPQLPFLGPPIAPFSSPMGQVIDWDDVGKSMRDLGSKPPSTT
ncbi:hypothetical protein PAXRUDRAFT_152043 [Paxillus rubicundulus Ve08.2h10]|uniref:Uncharacterized protein n=1 Tax=Paxillus rubicundulus Ve08.2h10 TaxID=930991 RepID=A0A0D0DVZ1_9AGAM|nr:hypothetical protein PAXRUDRAFT_152043 [Paxillus rubicundulus Ve08.2h10]